MMHRTFMGAVILFFMPFPCLAPASGQNSSTGPLDAAARYVLTLEDFQGLGTQLVIDTTFPGHVKETAASRQIEEVARGLVRALGAAKGDLEEIRSCPTEMPAGRGYQGCTFAGPTRAVLELGEPEFTDGGALVWVTVWRLIDRPDLDVHYISAIGRLLKLTENSPDDWTVVKIETEQHARW